MTIDLKLSLLLILLFGAKFCQCNNETKQVKEKLEQLFQKYFQWKLGKTLLFFGFKILFNPDINY